MKKNLLVTFLVVLIVAGILAGLWWWSRRWITQPVDPWEMIPQDAIMVLESNDVSELYDFLIHKSEIWNDLQKVSGIGKMNRKLMKIDTLIAGERPLKQLMEKNKILISFHEVGKNKLALLGAINIPGHVKAAEIRNSLATLSKIHEESKPRVQIYNGYKISRIELSEGGQLFYTISKGLFLFSNSKIILESAIRQGLSNTSILNDKGFSKVKNTAGTHALGNLYLKADRIPIWLSSRLKASTLAHLGKLVPMTGWIELDISLDRETLLLNGFGSADHQEQTLFDVLIDQDPLAIDLYSVFPSSANAGIILAVKDLKNYFSKVSEFRDKRNQKEFQNIVTQYKTECNCNLVDELLKVTGNQAGVIYLNIPSLTPQKSRVAVLEVKSQNMAMETIESQLKSFAKNRKIAWTSLFRTVKLDRETSLKIYKYPFGNIFSNIFGSYVGVGNYDFVAFYNNYLISSSNEKTLIRFVQDNIRKQTLDKDPDFRKFLGGFASRSNFLLFFHLPQIIDFAGLYFKDSFLSGYKDYASSPMKVEYAGYQAIQQNNMIYHNIYVQYLDKIKKNTATVWQSLLDTISRYKPQLFVNHYTRENEIFLQDLAGKIYLINNSGRILWKEKIPEQILGKAYQVDYYKNGKLQIMFNTRHYLYLIDRNGNSVEHFPVRLRAPATNEMSLFDYEKDLDYRIFVGGEDRKMYLYNKDGKIVPGWNLKQHESTITTPVHHYRIGTKDYIVYSDAMNLYILDRRGNTRVKVKKQIPRAHHQNIVLNSWSQGGPKIMVNGLGGKVYRVSFTGKVETVVFSELPDELFFDFADLNGDGKGEYIFLSDAGLAVYDNPERKLYSLNLDFQPQFPPVLFNFSSRDWKIGVVDATKHRIFLVNNNGDLYDGFPLKGNSPFTIGRFQAGERRFNLVVGGEDNFLYNYIVK